jgi:hypothetical protein
MIFRKLMLTWLLTIAFGLAMSEAMLCLESVVFGQYAEPIEVQVVKSLPWAEVQTNDFEYHGEGYLIDHLRDHPMLGDELERLHEWLHQRIERLRPRDNNGASYSTVFFEGTDAQFNAWAERQAIEAAGWKVVRLPSRERLVNIVAIGKTHFSHAGHLTIDALRRFVNQVENRQFKPIKNARARFVKSIKMMTRANCSWCEKWKQTDYGQAVADGVTVELVTDASGTVPRFEVCDSEGRCRQYVGYKSYTDMKRDIQ